jgi:hypothetical protein
MSKDKQLLTDFVASFAALDELIVFRSEEVAPELMAGWIDGYERWQPIRVIADRSALELPYQHLAKRFPPLFEEPILSYRWISVDLGMFELLPNPPGEDLGSMLKAILVDRVLTKVLLPRGFVQFARAPGGSYDPICFDTNRPTKHGDYPIIQFEHESIICDEQIGRLELVSPSFRTAVIDIISSANDLKRRPNRSDA